MTLRKFYGLVKKKTYNKEDFILCAKKDGQGITLVTIIVKEQQGTGVRVRDAVRELNKEYGADGFKFKSISVDDLCK